MKRVGGLLLCLGDRTATNHDSRDGEQAHDAETEHPGTERRRAREQVAGVSGGRRGLAGCRRRLLRGRRSRRRRGRRDLAALDLFLREGTGARLDCGRDVLRVLDDLPGRTLDEHDLVGCGGLGARLRHLGVTTHPLAIDPLGVGHLGLGDLGLAALDLLLREGTGARLDRGCNVLRVLDDLPG